MMSTTIRSRCTRMTNKPRDCLTELTTAMPNLITDPTSIEQSKHKRLGRIREHKKAASVCCATSTTQPSMSRAPSEPQTNLAQGQLHTNTPIPNPVQVNHLIPIITLSQKCLAYLQRRNIQLEEVLPAIYEYRGCQLEIE
uniref:Uncharacterized protein n=1 Tax=Heterorhabditis bacteriophora TaxID=37862 RepID=A0A1I7X922_HETBA